MKSRTRVGIVFLCILIGFIVSIWGMNEPFVGIYNANNNYLSLAAKNYFRFGFVRLHFLPTYFAGKTLPTPVPYYLHHPILIFLLVTIPHALFGFGNWVGQINDLIFTIGSIVVLYKLAKEIWDEKVAMWSAAVASLFPILTFFWKYMFFEQGSLLFLLLTYYQIVQYLKKKKRKSLVFLFLFALIAGFIDWGVLYLLVPVGIFYFSKYRTSLFAPYGTYVTATVLSLGTFISIVLFIQHGFGPLAGAIGTRSLTGELTSLPLWPIRLIIISILRILLYFTPFAVVAAYQAWRVVRKRRVLDIPELTLVAFFIFGLLNILVLPTATWGHSYFLFYFVPFFAISGGIWFAQNEHRRTLIIVWLLIIGASSIAVNYLKLQQVVKQEWKYTAAAEINATLSPYESVTVVNFPGDVFENYFLHPTHAIATDQIDAWLRGTLYPSDRTLVFACEGACTGRELAVADTLKYAGTLVALNDHGNRTWIAIRTSGNVELPPTQFPPAGSSQSPRTGNMILRIYRAVRDTLSVGQI